MKFSPIFPACAAVLALAQTVTAQPSAPPLNVSWGATFTSGNYWTGNAPYDDGADLADPALVAGPGRLVLTYEADLDQFFNPQHGDDSQGNHYDAFKYVLGPSLPAPQDGFVTSKPQVLIDQACPDNLGNRHDCYILMARSIRNSDHSAWIALSASSFTGTVNIGAWNSTAFDVSHNHTVYPGRIVAGSTNNAIVAAADMWDWNGKYQFSEIWVIAKAGLYPVTGQRPSFYARSGLKNTDGVLASGLVPAVSYVDAPFTYMVNADVPISKTANKVTVWKVDTTNPADPKLFNWTPTVDDFEEAPPAAQAGSDVPINTWYATFTSAVLQGDRLWAVQTTGCTFNGDTVVRSCLRWYEFDMTALSVAQQQTWGWLGAYVYDPSISANALGDATIVFNASSDKLDAGVYYVGRKASDPPSTLSNAAVLHAGSACFVRQFSGGLNGVGGTTAVALDLSDNQSFWMTGAFAVGNSSDCKANHWGMWVGRITWPASTPQNPGASVVSSASFKTGPIAPGSLITIFGKNLAGSTQPASTLPLPTNLAGVSVSANGMTVPLLYASPDQINAQLPFGITGTTATLTVTTNGVAGSPMRVDVAKTAPGIFQFSGNRAVATNQDNSLNTSSNPAKIGSVITVYITGQGAFDNPIPDGAAAPSSPLSRTAVNTTATIGGQPANVLFSGATPGLVGVAQVNVAVPGGVQAGDTPLVITIGGVASNSTTISVTN
jgi:uncharacterized protein (TIGR03437 family)